MIVLPTEKRKIEGQIEPRKMLIFGGVKVGKTSLLAGLPNALIIDLESGANYFECQSIDIKEEAMTHNTHPITMYKSVAQEIKKANLAAGKKVYDFIVLDTLSALEDMATELATIQYKGTVAGKSFTGSSVVTGLSQGGGYGLLRESFDELLSVYENLAGKCLILIGHVKAASIMKKGDSIQAKDLNLAGKLKLIISGSTDLNGILFRDKSSKKNILSFMSEETDLVTGSRIPQLSGREIVISEMNDKNELTTHWDLIFPSINK